ncbi:hypothetical protein Tco_1006888 [Tanacetum coccineum]|uniref:Uncharacterized protein n=1 Tax=Tanacetum coccineum TaxID=301880 RepID=A0ABQ5FJ77_9ASTR
MMVVKEIVSRLLEEVEVSLLGKKQDVDDEEEEDEEGESGSEVGGQRYKKRGKLKIFVPPGGGPISPGETTLDDEEMFWDEDEELE